jgi:hypothetical protein
VCATERVVERPCLADATIVLEGGLPEPNGGRGAGGTRAVRRPVLPEPNGGRGAGGTRAVRRPVEVAPFDDKYWLTSPFPVWESLAIPGSNLRGVSPR